MRGVLAQRAYGDAPSVSEAQACMCRVHATLRDIPG